MSPTFPTRLSWRVPLLLYLLTWITTTAVRDGAPAMSLVSALLLSFGTEDHAVLLANFGTLFTQAILDGLWFSVPLMFILSCHELGHFMQSRRYRVAASLPYFIPLPIGPFGTLGAVIVMDGQIPHSKALFDIGIFGPLAGLVPTLICCYVGIEWSLLAPRDFAVGELIFGDPLLFQWLTRFIHGEMAAGITLCAHPVAMAGWIGLLLTSLNLMPFGQLDGGHVFHALCGRKAAWLSRGIYYAIIIAVLWFQLWHWLLLLFLLAVMGISHPATQNDSMPLGITRRVLGWCTLAFVLIGLTPVPMQVEENVSPENEPPGIIVQADAHLFHQVYSSAPESSECSSSARMVKSCSRALRYSSSTSASVCCAMSTSSDVHSPIE